MCAKQLNFFETEEDKSYSKRKTVTLPLDTLLLLGIVIVLLFVFSFSLGVEKGRKTVIINKPSNEKTPISSETFPVNLHNVALEVDMPNKREEKKLPERNNKVPSQGMENYAKVTKDLSQNFEVAPLATQELKPLNYEEKYAIQVISCLGQTCAQEVLKKMQKEGFPAYIAKKNNFIVVYAGVFKNKAQAQKSLDLLKKTYKDCILRRL
jgi:cell division septation protein DedD